jgi:ribosomal protein L15
MDLLHSGSGSSATRGGRGGNNRGNGGRPQQNSSNADHPTCQLCGKEGHTVLRCYKRFDASFTGRPKQQFVSSATTYGIDTN